MFFIKAAKIEIELLCSQPVDNLSKLTYIKGFKATSGVYIIFMQTPTLYPKPLLYMRIISGTISDDIYACLAAQNTTYMESTEPTAISYTK